MVEHNDIIECHNCGQLAAVKREALHTYFVIDGEEYVDPKPADEWYICSNCGKEINSDGQV